MAAAMKQLDLTSDLQASNRRPVSPRKYCSWAGCCSATCWGQSKPDFVQPFSSSPCSIDPALQPCFLSVSPYHLPDMTDRQWRKLGDEWTHAPAASPRLAHCLFGPPCHACCHGSMPALLSIGSVSPPQICSTLQLSHALAASLLQAEKDALLRLAGSCEDADFAERFQHFVAARQLEAGPEDGQGRHMRAPRPEEQRCQRLCQRILAALALRALLQEVRGMRDMWGGAADCWRCMRGAEMRSLLPGPLKQGATEEAVRQEFGYGELGRAFVDMRVRLAPQGMVMARQVGLGP